MGCSLISLTTDFGLRDSYVAEMKGVILGIIPNARIVDITHQIEKFNVKMGAYVLASASPQFPDGSVHLAIVDPGVGTKRRPIIVKTNKCFFVGPDNGVLALAVKNIGDKAQIYKIINNAFMLPEVSRTFHGRDIFAPAAAYLARGTSPAKFGPEIKRMRIPKFARSIRKRDRMEGQVIYIDDFGNIVTNLTETDLKRIRIKGKVNVKLGSTELKLPFCGAYGDVERGKRLAIVGSHNFLEISVNQGNAAKGLKAQIGDKVVVC